MEVALQQRDNGRDGTIQQSSLVLSRLAAARPLLPDSLASIVSLLSLSSRVSLRALALWIELLLDSTRFCTITSLGFTRRTLVSAVETARHLHTVSQKLYGKESDDDGAFLLVLDKWTNLGAYMIHSAFSLAELFALSGFYFVSSAVSTSLSTAEESVKLLDSILGSNETSRALSAIISLIRSELAEDPRSLDERGTITTLTSLTKAMVAFACLQSATRRRTLKEMKSRVIYDCSIIIGETAQPPSPNAAAKGQSIDAGGDSVMKDAMISRRNSVVVPDEDEDTIVLHELDHLLRTEDLPNDVKDALREAKVGGSLPAGFEIEIEEETITTRTRILRAVSNEGLSLSDGIITSEARSQEDDGWVEVSSLPPSPTRPRIQVALRSITNVITRKKRTIRGSAGEMVMNEPSVEEPRKKSGLFKFKALTKLRRPDPFSRPPFLTSASTSARQKSSTSPFGSSASTPTQSGSSSPTKGEAPRLHRSASSRSMRSIMTTCTTNTAAIPVEEQEPIASNYPRQHSVSNLQRYMRYASAAYGQSFLRILKIGKSDFNFPTTSSIHANNHAFANHVGIDVHDILLSSYHDTSSFSNHQITPIVNYVALDHEMKAVVLSCRGSLGISDLLVDLMCEYEHVQLPYGDPNASYEAHSGILHSATTLQRGLVHQTIKDTLKAHPDYGIVLCGHSLGGGVAALLSVLWSQPATSFEEVSGRIQHPPIHTPFVTSIASGLPPGRPICAYTFGSPAIASLDLVEYCRGLVISTIHYLDIVPTLSLGVLRDLKTMANGLYAENGLSEEIVKRVLGLHQRRFISNRQRTAQSTNPGSEMLADVAFSASEFATGIGANRAGNADYEDPCLFDENQGVEVESDQQQLQDWLWSLVKTMRAANENDKLYPAGLIRVIESHTVFISNDTTDGGRYTRKEGRRILLRAVDDVVARFGEPVFGRSMLTDHSPLAYESSLDYLHAAVIGS